MVYSTKDWTSGEKIVESDMDRMEDGIRGRCATAVVEPNGNFGDYATIQAAINAVGAGGKVFLRKGAYTISAPLTIPNSSLTLEGEGLGTTISLANGVNASMIRIATGSPISSVCIKSINLNGNKANQTAGNGIELINACNYLKLENLLVSSIYTHGIFLNGGGDWPIVKDCLVYGTGGYGICGSALALDGVVQGCNVGTVGTSTVANNGIHWLGARGQILDNRLGTNITLKAIHLNAVDILVRGNRIYGPGANGIYGAASADRLQVMGNFISEADTHSIELLGSHCVVNGNIIRNIYGTGNGIKASASYIAIVGNNLYNTYNEGIYLNSDHCSVIGNVLQKCGSQAGSAVIYINGVGFCTIQGNTLKHEVGDIVNGIVEGVGGNYNVISGNALQGYTNPITFVGVNTEVTGNNADN